jgi:hypothetical protein
MARTKLPTTGFSVTEALTNLERLEAGDYIERSAAVGHAYEYKVQLLTD